MMTERDFKGIWIPKDIWLNKDLSVMEKLFLVEIDSLDNENGCFASNKYFSEFFNITKGRCTQIIKSLESKGLINIVYKYEGKEIKKRVIRVVNKLTTPVNILNKGSKKTKQGYIENDDDSNTSNSNTSNNNTQSSDLDRQFSREDNLRIELSNSDDASSNNKEKANTDSFEEFWKIYPNKKSKKKAMTLFEKVIEDKETTFEELIEGAKKYAMEVDEKGTPDKYVKHPTTWLAQGCWADDYDLYEPTRTDERYNNLPI